MLRRPPRSTLFPYTTLSDLGFAGNALNMSNTEVARNSATQDSFAGGGHLCVDRKSTRLNSSHVEMSYAVFCLKKKKLTTLSRCSRRKSQQRVQASPRQSLRA